MNDNKGMYCTSVTLMYSGTCIIRHPLGIKNMLDYRGCRFMEANILQSIVVEVSQNVLDYKESWFIEMSDYAVSTVLGF